MASLSTPTTYPPLFTKERLTEFENELEKDGDPITIQNELGLVKAFSNTCHGNGLADLPASEPDPMHNSVLFMSEYFWEAYKKFGKPDDYQSLELRTMRAHYGVPRSLEDIRISLRAGLDRYAESEEGQAMVQMIQDNLRGNNMDKIFAFGLGPLSYSSAREHESRSNEHAAARVIATTIREMNPKKDITVYLQDPAYRSDCRQVLGVAGFKVIHCYGAKGFTLIDDNSFVFCHNPDFPFREIVADIARPAVLGMRPQRSEAESRSEEEQRKVDRDSVRSRKMLEEYQMVNVGRQGEILGSNAWYVKNSVVDKSSRSPQSSPRKDAKRERDHAYPSPPLSREPSGEVKKETGKSRRMFVEDFSHVRRLSENMEINDFMGPYLLDSSGPPEWQANEVMHMNPRFQTLVKYCLNIYFTSLSQCAYVTDTVGLEEGVPGEPDYIRLTEMRLHDMVVDNYLAAGGDLKTLRLVGVSLVKSTAAYHSIKKAFEDAGMTFLSEDFVEIKPGEPNFEELAKGNPFTRSLLTLLRLYKEETGHAFIKRIVFISAGYDGPTDPIPIGQPELYMVTELGRPEP
ncbi:Uu.00g117280.m01.CDS01 [Anthostomella pinea]|uniref:Uu.00g117280.m01.CDS01 n=1 Tax=Anthostomella pinea TaxID=933095 RepID=A0AAI8YGX0_9PEZI|nr:Uu.00g117280.m01.CDS01 [Anthostomella pinea]